MVAVADDERDWRPERRSVAKTGENLDLVRFQLLPRAPPVALASPAQVVVNRRPVEREAGGESCQDRDERRSVRLPRGDELEAARLEGYAMARSEAMALVVECLR